MNTKDSREPFELGTINVTASYLLFFGQGTNARAA